MNRDVHNFISLHLIYMCSFMFLALNYITKFRNDILRLDDLNKDYDIFRICVNGILQGSIM